MDPYYPNAPRYQRISTFRTAWQTIVPWAIALLVLGVASATTIEAHGYHYIHPQAFIVAYTAITGALFVAWLALNMCLYDSTVDSRVYPYRADADSYTTRTREQWLLTKIHQSTSQYREAVTAAGVIGFLVWALTVALLWLWYHKHVVLPTPAATVSSGGMVGDDNDASDRWFHYLTVIAYSHWLLLYVVAQALAQKHILLFYDPNTLGLLRRNVDNVYPAHYTVQDRQRREAPRYLIRPLSGNELMQLASVQDGNIYLYGAERERSRLAALAPWHQVGQQPFASLARNDDALPRSATLWASSMTMMSQ